jgi:hypothetical protein
MRKSFRVATAFTGAAAAVTGFAPAAGAATAAPAVTPAATGTAHAGNCTQAKTYDLVLHYAKAERHASPACVTGTGFVAIGDGGVHFSSYCAGAAFSGYLWINHSPRPFADNATLHKLYGADVSGVTIYSHGVIGNAPKCAG